MKTETGEIRYYHPVPWSIRYGMADWLSRQSCVANYHFRRFHGINAPETIEVVFKPQATSQQKARIGRTFAWDKVRRLKKIPDGDTGDVSISAKG
jgi:hypothetical protein